MTFAGVRNHVMIGHPESCRASIMKCFESPTVLDKLKNTKTVVDVKEVLYNRNKKIKIHFFDNKLLL